MTQINFAQLNQEYGGSDPIPDGDYDVSVGSAQVKTSRGTPPKFMIEGRLRILHGPYANRVFVHNWTLTPDSGGAMWHWFRNFAILGLDKNYWDQLSAMGLPTEQQLQHVAQSIANRTVSVTLKTTGDRQNADSWRIQAGGPMSASPAPQTPQPGYGMQMPGQMPVMPQMGQPQYAQQLQYGQQPQYTQPAAVAPSVGMPQPPQPQVAPPPVGGMPVPQVQQGQWPGQSVDGQQVQQQPQMQQAMPTPPGFQQVDPNQGQPQPQMPGQQAMPTPPGFPQQGQPQDQQVAPQPAMPPGQVPGFPQAQQQQAVIPQPGTQPPQVPV